MSLTEGRGVDVILEMLANVNLGNDLNVLARGGRVATIGNRGPGNQGTATISPRAIMSRDASILGIALGMPPSANSPVCTPPSVPDLPLAPCGQSLARSCHWPKLPRRTTRLSNRVPMARSC